MRSKTVLGSKCIIFLESSAIFRLSTTAYQISFPQFRHNSTTWTKNKYNRYPEDFQNIFSEVKTYKCPTSKKRVIISNNMPDHDVTIWRNSNPCEVYSAVEIPLDPENPDPNMTSSQRTEVPMRGMVAMAKNGGELNHKDAFKPIQYYMHRVQNLNFFVHFRQFARTQFRPMDRKNLMA